jgi:hypothetical protein
VAKLLKTNLPLAQGEVTVQTFNNLVRVLEINLGSVDTDNTTQLTTAERDEGNFNLGQIIYNTTTTTLQYWDGSTFQDISALGAINLNVSDGTTGITINLNTETMSLIGGTGITSTASGNSVTFAIDSTVTTLTGSQTLTNKTLTSPTLNSPVLNGTLSGSAFLDEDNMASNSATAVASQQSIKAYVNSQVGTADTLAEILATGNTTGGTNIAVSANDNITFADNSKAIFGNGSDLQIYHDESNSYIQDAGTGTLRILSDDVRIMNAAGTEISAQFIQDGEARLKYDNVTKLATKSTGIDVTGTAVVDGLTSSGNLLVSGDLFTVNTGTNGVGIGTDSPTAGTFVVANPSKFEDAVTFESGVVFNETGASTVDFRVESDTNTHALFVDASTNRVGIFNNAPSQALDVTGQVLSTSLKTTGQLEVVQTTTNPASGGIRFLVGGVADSDGNNFKLEAPSEALDMGLQSASGVEINVGATDTNGSGNLSLAKLNFAWSDTATQLTLTGKTRHDAAVSVNRTAYNLYVDGDDTGYIQHNFNDFLAVKGASGSSVGLLQLYEASNNGSNYVALKSPTTVASNVTFTLPSTDGSADQFIKTDGSGNLSFASATITGATNMADNRVLTASGSTTVNGEANLTFDGSTLDLFGTLSVSRKIIHRGDENTYIDFTGDDISFFAGGVEFISLNEAGSDTITLHQNTTASGNLIVSGDLTVNGTTTTLNTATLDVEDKNITLNFSTGDSSASANGAGITIQDAVNSTTDATILWDATNDEFDFSHPINITGSITTSGDASISGNLGIGRAPDNTFDLDVNGTSKFRDDVLFVGTTADITFDASNNRLKFPDTAKASFGTDNDLLIYHDSGSVIEDVGTNGLEIRTNGPDIRMISGSNELMAKFIKDGAVELYHGNSGSGANKRLETTSSGVSMAGGLVVEGSTQFNDDANFSGALQIGGTAVTSTAAELNKLDGFTGTVTDLNYVKDLRATGVTSTEYDFLDGVTSNIQTQINAISTVTINNNADNRLITGSGTANTLNAESTATFTAGRLTLATASGGGQANQPTLILTDTDATLQTTTLKQIDGVTTLTSQNGTGATGAIRFVGVSGAGSINNTQYGGFDASGNFEIGTTDVIDASRNLQNLESIVMPDSKVIKIGTDLDLQLLHDGSNSIIKNVATGNLIIRNIVDDGDIILQSDDGSGGLRNYITLNGSEALTKFGQDAKFGDSKVLKFGDSNDLQIYHDGSNSYIKDAGTGNLRIDATNFYVRNSAGTELKIGAIDDGAVDLYHNGSKKLATTSTGIDVTGTAVVDGLTSSGSVAITTTSGLPLTVSGHDTWNYPLRITNTTASTNLDLKQGTGGASILTTSAVLTFQTASTERARFTATGLGIGTTSPLYKLHVQNSGNVALFGDGTRFFRVYTDSDEVSLLADGSVPMKFFTSGAEKMRIDTSGNLLVGTTSTTLYSATSGGGILLDPNGPSTIARESSGTQPCLILNNTGSDGQVLQFRKDGSTVGSIGVDNADNLVIEGDSSHSGLQFGSATILPHKNGAVINNNISLGNNTYKFSNLTLGGTATVNQVSINGTTVIDSSRNLTNIGTISSGKIGVGANTASYWSQANSLVLDDSGNTGLTIKSGTSGNGRVVFTDTTSTTAGLNDGGQINYGHTNDEMKIRTAGTDALTISSSQNATFAGNATFSGVIGVGGTSTNSSFGVYLQNNKWYATQYSSSHDIVRMNANTSGGLDIYNQTDNGFANVRVGSLNIGSTTVIDSSRNLVNIGTYSGSGNISVTTASSPSLALQDTTNNVIFKSYAQNSNAFTGTTSNHTLNIGTNNTAAITLLHQAT